MMLVLFRSRRSSRRWTRLVTASCLKSSGCRSSQLPAVRPQCKSGLDASWRRNLFGHLSTYGGLRALLCICSPSSNWLTCIFASSRGLKVHFSTHHQLQWGVVVGARAANVCWNENMEPLGARLPRHLSPRPPWQKTVGVTCSNITGRRSPHFSTRWIETTMENSHSRSSWGRRLHWSNCFVAWTEKEMGASPNTSV